MMPSSHRHKHVMRIFLSLSLSTSLAFPQAEWRESISPSKPGTHPPITPAKLEYRLSWKGTLDAGSLFIDFAPQGIKKSGAMVVTSRASSHGAAAMLFPYSHSYWSEIQHKSLLPRFFHSTKTDASEKVETTNRFTPDEVSVRENSEHFKQNIKSARSFTFPYGPAHDIFSAILHLRSQKLHLGDTHTMLLLPFKTPYLATIRVDAREKNRGRDAIRLNIAMRKIDTDTLELGSYKKLKKPITLWLSDDKDRILLEARASVYIGYVHAVLTKHEIHK